MPDPESKSHIIEGSSGRMDANGYTIVEVHKIRGMPRVSSLLYDAMKFTGLRYYDPYEPDPTLRLDSIDAKPIAKCRDGCTLIVTYSQNMAPSIRFTGVTQDTLTNYDIDGNVIKVDYPLPAADTDLKDSLGNVVGTVAGTGSPETITQVGQATGSKAIGDFECEFYVEKNPQWMLPYLNTLNSSRFRDGDKYTWWCTVVGIEKRKYCRVWKVQLAFRYDEETWIKPSVYRDGNGIIPTDIDKFVRKFTKQGEKHGYTNPKIRGESDLSKLPVPDVT